MVSEINISTFSMPKIGEDRQDIQDAFAHNRDRSRAAIADGASSSLFPEKWAKLLVEEFCDSSDSPTIISKSSQDWLKPLQEKWREYYLSKLGDSQLPWWAKGSTNKDHGAATFIGFQIENNVAEKRRWEAIAIGDSCLFRISSDFKLVESFPLENARDFKSVTNCFHSLPEYKSTEPKLKRGEYHAGDIFILATDALAEWIIRDCDNNDSKLQELIDIESEDEFTKFIEILRDKNLIKNDDTTVAVIKIIDKSPNSTSIQSLEQQPVITEAPIPSLDSLSDRDSSKSKSNLKQTPSKSDAKLIALLFGSVVTNIVLALGIMFFVLRNAETNKAINPPASPTSSQANMADSKQLSITLVCLFHPQSLPDSSSRNFVGLLLINPPSNQLPSIFVPKKFVNQGNTIIIPSERPFQIEKTTQDQEIPNHYIGYLLPGKYPYYLMSNSNYNQEKIQVDLSGWQKNCTS